MKWIYSILLVWGLLVVFPVGAQEENLETRLANATGIKRVSILVALTELYRAREYDKAYRYGQEALALLQQFPDHKREVVVLLQLGTIAYRQGNYEIAIQHAQRALSLLPKRDNSRDHAAAFYILAMGHKYLANYPLALTFLFKARTIYEQWGEKNEMARCLNQIGLVYRRLNEFPKALEYIMQSGLLYDQLEDRRNLSSIYNNIGIIHEEMGQPMLALDYYQKALIIDEEEHNQNNMAISWMNIASIYDHQGKAAEALELYKKSLAVLEKLGASKDLSNLLSSMGHHYLNKKNYAKALGYFTRAKKIKEEIHEYYGIAEVFLSMGMIYRCLGQYDHSQRYLIEAVTLSTRIHSTVNLRDSYLELAVLFQQQNDYANALSYYKKYKEANDGVFNEKNSRRLAELQTQFDLERKEKEISILKKNQEIRALDLGRQRGFITYLIIISLLTLFLAFVTYTRYRLKNRVNRQLVRYQEHLSELVEERTRELKEAQVERVRDERLSVLGQLTATVAHEIRNPLGAARASIFSIEKALENNNPQRVQQALQLAEHNLVRCDRIIDDLLNFTRRRELRFQPIAIDEWVEQVLLPLRVPDGITIKKEYQAGILVPIDSERLLRAIINTWNNALEALQEKENKTRLLTISTFFNKAHQRLDICFSDTGPGIPQENLDKIFEPLFTTKRFGFGLGLPVVKTIMNEHHGGVDINSQPGVGTRVTLWLPVPPLAPDIPPTSP